jgi:hypothetical protein
LDILYGDADVVNAFDHFQNAAFPLYSPNARRSASDISPTVA